MYYCCAGFIYFVYSITQVSKLFDSMRKNLNTQLESSTTNSKWTLEVGDVAQRMKVLAFRPYNLESDA